MQGNVCSRKVPFLSTRKSHRPAIVQGTVSPCSGLTYGQCEDFIFFLCFGLWLSLGAVLLDTGCYRGCGYDVMASRGSQLFCSCVCLGCRQPPCALWLEANQGHTEDEGSSPSGYTFGSAFDLGRQANSISPQTKLGASVKNIEETPKQASCRPG